MSRAKATGGANPQAKVAAKSSTPKATVEGANPADADKAGQAVVEVTGPPRGFRRAGRRFGPEPTVIPMADLSDAEIAALSGDPNLVTVIRGAADN